MAENEVLLRLVMKGMDPAEAARFAGQSLSAVTAEVNAALAKQVEAHKKAAEATTAESKKAAQAEIKEATEKTKGVITAMRAVEAESKKAAGMSQAHWRRLFEDMENLTVVSQGFAAAVSSIVGKLKEMSEEIINTTNIMGSLKGSVSEASAATQGTVANMDLIIAKNQAMEQGLDLTDQQFADIAQRSDEFADSMGQKTLPVMDKLIQSLATGTIKGLKQLNVVQDADKAYQAFAKSIGTTSDMLSDEGKRTALQSAAFIELRKRAIESAEGLTKPVNVATALEQAIVSTKNSWDAFVARIGSWEAPDWFKEFLDPTYRVTKFVNQIASGRASVDAVALQFNKSKISLPEGKSRGAMIDQEKAAKKAAAEHAKIYQPNKGIDSLLEAAALAEEQRNSQIRSEADQIGELMANFGQKEIGGVVTGTGQAEEDVKVYDETRKQMIEGLHESLQEIQDQVAMFDETNQRAGGGVFARILFGPNGPDQMYEELDGFSRAVVDSVGMLSNAAEGMAGAFGQSFAAWAQGEKSFKAAMTEATRDVLKNLATQAATHAIMETALGIGSLALGPIGGVSAAGHFAAAGAFAAVAGSAAAGLRALGPTPTAGRSTGSTPTTPRTPEFTSAGGSRGGSGDGGARPVVINVSVFPGGESAAGASVIKSLEAYKAQTGRGIEHLVS